MESSSRMRNLIDAESSPLLQRVRDCKLYCVACKSVQHDDPKPKKNMSRCSRCQFVRYCSKDCQKSHWRLHKYHCLAMDELQQNSNRDEMMYTLGCLKFEFACRYFDTLEEGKYLFEDSLDCFVQCYEKLRRAPRIHGFLLPLRSRIPFLLAALGHLELAVLETQLAMFPIDLCEDLNRREGLTVFSDLLMMGLKEGSPTTLIHSWPCSFLVPLLLAKMKLFANQIEALEESLECFLSTAIGSQLRPVQFVLSDFCVSDQRNQMEFLFDLILLRNGNFFDFGGDGPEDEWQSIFVEIEGGRLGTPLRPYEREFLQRCFQQDRDISRIVTEQLQKSGERVERGDNPYVRGLLEATWEANDGHPIR